MHNFNNPVILKGKNKVKWYAFKKCVVLHKVSMEKRREEKSTEERVLRLIEDFNEANR